MKAIKVNLLELPKVKVSPAGRRWNWKIEPCEFNYLHVTRRVFRTNLEESRTVNSTLLIIQQKKVSEILSEIFNRERERERENNRKIKICWGPVFSWEWRPSQHQYKEGYQNNSYAN